ncbi:CHRD domain-containing protein [Psychroflexus sediminis]|uniref:CHRD domain-containing protein n=1 Tax=Psychroflexus sediminis TaxID=470826 RepID=A0A1G7WC00_9FLAO|nr:CHRD domain-containing protein [Psychroflexus sediminis]SDG69527.1 CHRD domain-containing protein [Psychroflexus sediminis]
MKKLKNLSLLLFIGVLFISCSDDDFEPYNGPILNSVEYDLDEKSDSGVSGDATFNEQEDGSVQLILEVQGTSSGNTHPAHIHMNSAAEGGGIIVSLEPVDGATGLSITTFTSLDDGTPISFGDIANLDAYINVHLSSDALGTIVAQGDIGQNVLTGESKSYDLGERAVEGISGTILFEERVNGEALATISLDGTPDGGVHPAHIHMNTAVEGGGIIYSFNAVSGTTGMSQSNVAELDDGTAFGYSDVLTVDGYVNVHLSADDLGTIVAQGDIGQNELTGESKSYNLEERAVPGINGSVLFEERVNGEALATISLDGTPDGGVHPAHIHMNTAVEGGGIIYTFNAVNGTTGMSQSNVAELDDGTAFGYSDVQVVDGYVNVHLSAADLGTIVAQGDIGQNELTGESKSYGLEERAVPGINGSVLFEERVNGEALATISLAGTPDGGTHPAHIHANSAVEGGGILYTFTPVNGTTGMSQSNVAELDDGTAFGYADVLDEDGYVNVHLSAGDLGTIVAQGDIGINELTGNSVTYNLAEADVAGISGSVVFEERVGGAALATISLTGTPDGGTHPAHIHENSAAEGGGIVYTFTPVDGTTGMSQSQVEALDDGTAFGYSDVLTVDGYVNVHLSANDLATIVAQGNIGAND